MFGYCVQAAASVDPADQLPGLGTGTRNSVPDFTRDPTIGTDCFTRTCVYSKRICSLDTGASSALGLLDDNALHKSTYLLTYPQLLQLGRSVYGAVSRLSGGR